MNAKRKSVLTFTTSSMPGLLVWAIFISILVYTYLIVITWPNLSQLMLTGTDDYLRGFRTLLLLEGNSPPFWTEPRIGPPGGISSHWSPLPNYLIVLVAWPISLFTDNQTAVLLAGRIYPFLMLCGFVMAQIWLVRGFVRTVHPLWILAAFIFTPGIFHQFQPGRIDHHSLTILLSVTAAGGLVQAFQCQRKLWAAVLAGCALGTGLASAAEMVPWLAILAVFGGLYWLIKGGQSARINLYFSASLLASSGGLFLILFPPSLWMASACDRISTDILVYVAAIAIFWTSVTVLQMRFDMGWRQRVVCGVALSIPILGLTIGLNSHCLTGAYGFEDPQFAQFWLGQMTEAKPLHVYAQGDFASYWVMASPMVLSLAGLGLVLPRRQDIRTLCLAYGFLILALIVLVFNQVRFAYAGHALLIPFLVMLLMYPKELVRTLLSQIWAISPRYRMMVLSLCLVAILGSLGWFLINKTSQDSPSMAANECRLQDLEETLSDLPVATIAAVPNHGFELLFRSSHRVLAGNHHRDEIGIALALDILFAEEDATALALMDDNEVGLILICEPNLEWPYHRSENQSVLVERLLENRIPNGLEPVAIQQSTGWRLYRRSSE